MENGEKVKMIDGLIGVVEQQSGGRLVAISCRSKNGTALDWYPQSWFRKNQRYNGIYCWRQIKNSD